jgi:predicted AAA+ superfamily ATPase
LLLAYFLVDARCHTHGLWLTGSGQDQRELLPAVTHHAHGVQLCVGVAHFQHIARATAQGGIAGRVGARAGQHLIMVPLQNTGAHRSR